MPPSTKIVVPVTSSLSSEASHVATSPRPRASPMRPRGMRVSSFSRASAVSQAGRLTRGADGAGRDGVDTDATRRHLLRKAFHHELDPAFGGGVIDVTGPGNELMRRTHADDLAGRARDVTDGFPLTIPRRGGAITGKAAATPLSDRGFPWVH